MSPVSVCLYQINVKTPKPLGPEVFVATDLTLGQKSVNIVFLKSNG